jgi:energy-coupling factor transporter transmembrane protein EcfT
MPSDGSWKFPLLVLPLTRQRFKGKGIYRKREKGVKINTKSNDARFEGVHRGIEINLKFLLFLFLCFFLLSELSFQKLHNLLRAFKFAVFYLTQL